MTADGRYRSIPATAVLAATALAALLLFAASLAPGAAYGAPAEFWQSKAGEVDTARGIAAEPATGHVYVSDQTGGRIVEFTAWGELVRMWGWDVVASGPNDTAPVDELEVCVPAEGDECQEGVRGAAGAGQFNSAAGIAIDPGGNVYAAEAGTPRRVQKFSSGGEFLLSFGGEVNKTTGADVCTKADLEGGDVCGAGITGTGPAEFSGPGGSLRTVIAVTPDDEVWVGDKDRIQRFDTDGEYQGQLNTPGKQAQQVAASPDGFLYVSYEAATNTAEPGIYKLDTETAGETLAVEDVRARAIAVEADGDIYAFDEALAQIRHYDPGGSEVEPPFGEGLESTGLATSSACGIAGPDVFQAVAAGFVQAYGPPPDPGLPGCEQPAVPPVIASQYAASVGTVSALVEARISPGFWLNATYYVEYGLADCAEAPCQRVLFPGAPLTDQVTSDPVAASADLIGLEPDTTYHFRFVAESGGGGPVVGPDTSFITYRQPVPDTDCPNQAFRGGPATKLPDCRAYEMVSPVDKNGGEATAGFYEGLKASFLYGGHDRATPDGGKLVYTATSPFGGPEGAPTLSEYVATRGGGGWESEPIDPPMEGGAANGVTNLDSQFKAFSDDLCTAWVAPEAGNPLSEPGPTADFRNLYRREGCGPSPTYTWLRSSAAEPEPCGGECVALPILFPDLQGVSGDGSCAAFRVNDALEVTGGPAPPAGVPSNPGVPDGYTAFQLYLWCEGEGVRLASVLPGGAAFDGSASAGSETSDPLEVGSRGAGHADTVQRALSADGSRLYWTPSGVSGKPRFLYLRVNARAEEESAVVAGKCSSPAKACTLQVSPSGPESSAVAQFWTASPDGERAIFSIPSSALNEEVGDLYEYAFDPVEGKGTRTKIADDTLGVAGSSEEATRLYFASRAVCSAEPNSEGEEAETRQGEPLPLRARRELHRGGARLHRGAGRGGPA